MSGYYVVLNVDGCLYGAGLTPEEAMTRSIELAREAGAIGPQTDPEMLSVTEAEWRDQCTAHECTYDLYRLVVDDGLQSAKSWFVDEEYDGGFLMKA